MPYDPMKDVAEFNQAFDYPVHLTPRMPSGSVRQLRINLIEEEFGEFVEADLHGDIIGVADGLADLLYVIYGAAHAYGIPIYEVFQEVHRSNMTKVWPDGVNRRREDGKTLKPDSYSPANINAVLLNHMEKMRCQANTESAVE